jgi:hypothetical protein
MLRSLSYIPEGQQGGESMLTIGRLLAICCAAGAVLAAGEEQVRRREITVNGRALSVEEQRRLEAVERRYGFRLPSGRFWYDNVSGAIGLWKGPAAGFLAAGLNLGPKMPPDCSTGGTGVFVNGRELHTIDVMTLRQFMMVLPGRWWVDAHGNGGPEGGPMMFNLIALAQQSRGRGSRNSAWSRRLDLGGGSMSVGGDGDFLYFMDSKGNSAYVGP